MTFTKESFIQLVDVLREQYDKDCAYAHKMGELLNSAEIPTYNWDSVNRFLVSQIQKQFPPSKEGECEFERYCFELNFGRDLDSNVVITPEMLWDKMSSSFVVKEIEFARAIIILNQLGLDYETITTKSTEELDELLKTFLTHTIASIGLEFRNFNNAWKEHDEQIRKVGKPISLVEFSSGLAEKYLDKIYPNKFIRLNWKTLEDLNIPSTHPLIDDSAVNNIEVNDAEVLSPSKN